MNNNKKVFVGGYFDDKAFVGEEFNNKTNFDEFIDTYTFQELVDYIGFKEVVELREEDLDWDTMDDFEKFKLLIEDISNDEKYRFLFFQTEKEAEEYKKEVLKELNDLKEIAVYAGVGKNEKGENVDVYTSKKNAINTGNKRVNDKGEEEDVYVMTDELHDHLYKNIGFIPANK